MTAISAIARGLEAGPSNSSRRAAPRASARRNSDGGTPAPGTVEGSEAAKPLVISPPRSAGISLQCRGEDKRWRVDTGVAERIQVALPRLDLFDDRHEQRSLVGGSALRLTIKE